MKPQIVVLMLLLPAITCAQSPKVPTRIFQFSITPGLSSNGIHPGGFSNYFSINISSGYSSANYLFEVAGISNLNVMETRGLQIAGLANLTGANAFASLSEKEIQKKLKQGWESNLSGIQIAGLTNFVLNNIFGAQFSGGFNIGHGALHGVQFSLFGNIITKYSFGLQLAGGFNVSNESIDGVQAAGLWNYTSGGLYGVQLGLLNKASLIEGINSFNNNQPTGLQLGLFNYAKSMNGFQIGLVNVSRQMQGTQLGLINFYNNGKTPETRDGTSIGLINIGSSGFLSIYSNELFLLNYELATGTVKNRRMNNEQFEKQVQNRIIYSKSALSGNDSWAFGYGLKKLFFTRSATPGYDKLNFLSYGIEFLQLNNRKNKLTRELNIAMRPNISAGSRIHPRNKMLYFFLSAAYNLYRPSGDQNVELIFRSKKAQTASDLQQWPGFAAGILIQ